jgi:hypothetical protein
MEGRELTDRVQRILDAGEPAGSPAESAYSREANLAMAAIFHHSQGRRSDALLALGAILDIARPSARREWVALLRDLAITHDLARPEVT